MAKGMSDARYSEITYRLTETWQRAAKRRAYHGKGRNYRLEARLDFRETDRTLPGVVPGYVILRVANATQEHGYDIEGRV